MAVVMILRVWALYSRSKFILGALIVLYTVDFILYLVDCFLLSTHDKVIGVFITAAYMHAPRLSSLSAALPVVQLPLLRCSTFRFVYYNPVPPP